MNIVKKLKDRNITSQIRFYGLKDMATGFEVKNIVENYELYSTLLDDIKPEIKSINGYINYLYVRCLSQYREAIPIIREDLVETVETIIKKAEDIFIQYKDEDIAKYINKNYKKILNTKFEGLYIDRDVIEFTAELICKFGRKNSAAIEYIIQNYSYVVYQNFDSFKILFDKSNDLVFYDMLMNKEHLDGDTYYHLKEITYVLKHLKEKNENKYNEIINVLIEHFKECTFNATLDDVMNKKFRLSDFIKTLKELKHKDCYLFEQELKQQEKVMKEYLEKRGHKYEFNMDLKPIISIIEDKSLKWYDKSLSLTHTKKEGQMVSIFDDIMKDAGKKGLIDYITTNLKTDSVFTYSLINLLSISLLYGKYALNYMLSDNKKIDELLSFVFMSVTYYFGRDNIHFNNSIFEFDINMLFDGLVELKIAEEQKNENKAKRIIYGLEMQLCGIIEKILRSVYYNITDEQQYMSFDSLSLRFLLRDNDIKKELGTGNCQCIEYLLNKRDGNIGKNIRNIFAHYSDALYDELTVDTILESLYILLVIANSLMYKKNITKRSKREKNENKI